MAAMAEAVDRATPTQRREVVRLLVERVVARNGTVSAAAITWTPPARPFFVGASSCVAGAPPDGLEPPTRTLGRCRSIH